MLSRHPQDCVDVEIFHTAFVQDPGFLLCVIMVFSPYLIVLVS
jgi:hypothetical protein